MCLGALCNPHSTPAPFCEDGRAQMGVRRWACARALAHIAVIFPRLPVRRGGACCPLTSRGRRRRRYAPARAQRHPPAAPRSDIRTEYRRPFLLRARAPCRPGRRGGRTYPQTGQEWSTGTAREHAAGARAPCPRPGRRRPRGCSLAAGGDARPLRGRAVFRSFLSGRELLSAGQSPLHELDQEFRL